MGRLYHKTIFSSTGTNDNAADHRDETASTASASAYEPDFVVLNSVHTTNEPLPNLGSSNLLQLQPMETIRFRRQDAMTTELPSRVDHGDVGQNRGRNYYCYKLGNPL